MLTAPQEKVLIFIDAYISEHGRAPSIRNIEIGIDANSTSHVHAKVVALQNRGYIRRLPGKARAIEILRMPGGERRLALDLWDMIKAALYHGRREGSEKCASTIRDLKQVGLIDGPA